MEDLASTHSQAVIIPVCLFYHKQTGRLTCFNTSVLCCTPTGDHLPTYQSLPVIGLLTGIMIRRSSFDPTEERMCAIHG